MLQPNAEDRLKKIGAWIFGPVYYYLLLALIAITITTALGLTDQWADNIFNICPHSSKGVIVLMAVAGLLLGLPRTVTSLNSQRSVPLPGLTWMNNPLYSEYYQTRSPSLNVKELIAEGDALKQEQNECSRLLEYSDIIGDAQNRAILNVQKLHRSLRNRLFEIRDSKDVNVDIRDMLNEIAVEICSTLIDDTADKSCSIMLVEGNELKIWGQNRIEPDSIKPTSFIRGVGFAGSIWLKAEAEILGDINTDPRFGRQPKYYGAIIGVPIVLWKEVIGVICVQSKKNNSFSPPDAGIIGNFSELIILILTMHQVISSRQEACNQLERECAAASDEGGQSNG